MRPQMQWLNPGIVAAGLWALGACSSAPAPEMPRPVDPADPTDDGKAGATGAPAEGGAGGAMAGATGGAMAGAMPAASDGGNAGAPGTSGRDAGAASDLPAGPGWAGVPGIDDLSAVQPSEGCGKDPGQALGAFVKYALAITPLPPRGTGNREYFIKLPAKYDKNKPYRLVFEGPGCGGTGTAVIDYARAAGAEGVIQIGLGPEPGLFLMTCFEDHRTDSVEYKFFETVYGLAQSKLCFDRHRVFVSGHSSGSWLSNMFGCVYGSRLIRGVAPSSGGLATGKTAAPPCTALPTPGIWTHNDDDTTNSPAGTRVAITRALKVNRCEGTFDTSPREPYPVPASAPASMVCERFSTCAKEFPIVLCHPKTGGHSVPSYFPTAAWQFFMSL